MSKHKPVLVGFSLFLFLLTLSFCAYGSPSNPVIFIHGLGSDVSAWQAFGSTLKQNQWIFGGCVTFNRSTGKVQPIQVPGICASTTSAPSTGDFYLMQFSDNQKLAFHEQAKELGAIIDAVSAVNAQAGVILIAHSMGGLAARSYLQQLSPTANKVLKLITVGTPHQGTNVAKIAQECPSNPLYICELAKDLIQIDPFSTAVTELRDDSLALMELNDLTRFPLPDTISYASIVGTGTTNILLNQDGDGIVPALSQDLGKVLERNSELHLSHTVRSIPIAACHITARPETHTCETGDPSVWTELLREIHPCHTFTSSSSVPTGWGVPWDVFSPTQLLLRAYCTESSEIADVGPATYIWHQGYALIGTVWQLFDLTCTGGAKVATWCPNSAAATLPNTAIYYAAYTCNYVNNTWKCGCRDQVCTTQTWQLQQIQR
jgi:pimeloyl-ACP methyl ester carboxylesterase